MPAHCSQDHATHTKSCLEWDEYDEAAYEMWDIAHTQEPAPSRATLKEMSDRLRELFPPKMP